MIMGLEEGLSNWWKGGIEMGMLEELLLGNLH